MTTEALLRVDPSEFSARRGVIAALDAATRAADGHGALGDAMWRDLARPGPDSAGFLVEGRGYLHVARDDSLDSSWTAGLIRLPEAPDNPVTRILLEAAIDHVKRHGGGTLACWSFGVSEPDDAAFAVTGFRPTRALFEMRAPLPIAATARRPTGISVRAFEPGRDEAEWLEVNNRAFAGHPDQGGWSESTLLARMQEPWFDPALFLLAFDSDGLAGFNWLKQHPARASDPVLGEIYVIGVDPRAQGTGLGRALAVEGLQEVQARGAVMGMLFSASDNTSALALYRSLGFRVHRTDRAYACQVRSTEACD